MFISNLHVLVYKQSCLSSCEHAIIRCNHKQNEPKYLLTNILFSKDEVSIHVLLKWLVLTCSVIEEMVLIIHPLFLFGIFNRVCMRLSSMLVYVVNTVPFP